MRNPTEEQIRKVMQTLGFDYIQARNHVICQLILKEKK